MGNIVPIGKAFDNLRAFAAHIASDPQAVGFAGVIVRQCDDGTGERELVKVNFKLTSGEMALVSIIMARMSLAQD